MRYLQASVRMTFVALLAHAGGCDSPPTHAGDAAVVDGPDAALSDGGPSDAAATDAAVTDAAATDAAVTDAAATDATAADATPPDAHVPLADAGPPGTLDPGFGTSGVQSLGGGLPISITRVDGLIVIGATGADRLMRVVPDTGVRDLTLGGNGDGDLLLDAADHTITPSGVASGGAGRYVIVGYGTGGSWAARLGGDFADRRFTTGALDPTFGTNGTIEVADNEQWSTRPLGKGDGKLFLFHLRIHFGGGVNLRVLDGVAGTLGGFVGLPAFHFDGNDTRIRSGAMAFTRLGDPIYAAGTQGYSYGVLSDEYWNENLGDEIIGGVAATAAKQAAVAVGSTVYFPGSPCAEPDGTGCVPFFNRPVPLGDPVHALVTDGQDRFYAAVGATVVRLDQFAVDPSFGVAGSFALPGLALAMLFDPPTNSLYVAGTSAGAIYLAKIIL